MVNNSNKVFFTQVGSVVSGGASWYCQKHGEFDIDVDSLTLLQHLGDDHGLRYLDGGE